MPNCIALRDGVLWFLMEAELSAKIAHFNFLDCSELTVKTGFSSKIKKEKNNKSLITIKVEYHFKLGRMWNKKANIIIPKEKHNQKTTRN